jgi:regulator of protease activity HflC (stomatin/prohibitin superfamily)
MATSVILSKKGPVSPPPSSPNDTRYPIPAVVAGTVTALGAAGLVLLTPLAAAAQWLAPAVGVILGALVGSSIKFADQWEKAVVLRLGKYRGLRGPGLFTVIPIVDRVTYHIDQRIRTTDFGAESCLTKDTVPVNVDAIAFWVVYDAERAALEVQQYQQAVVLAAQTALRDAIGKHDLGELIQSRKELGRVLQETLDKKMHDWGIQVQSVEIRDVIIPKALEEAMSRQAQAERERQARIILGTAETEIASKFVTAAETYSENPVAMNLRAMNMLYESIVKRGSLMVVPSGLAERRALTASCLPRNRVRAKRAPARPPRGSWATGHRSSHETQLKRTPSLPKDPGDQPGFFVVGTHRATSACSPLIKPRRRQGQHLPHLSPQRLRHVAGLWRRVSAHVAGPHT